MFYTKGNHTHAIMNFALSRDDPKRVGVLSRNRDFVSFINRQYKVFSGWKSCKAGTLTVIPERNLQGRCGVIESFEPNREMDEHDPTFVITKETLKFMRGGTPLAVPENLHVTVRPLRAALYKRLGIKECVEETFPMLEVFNTADTVADVNPEETRVDGKAEEEAGTVVNHEEDVEADTEKVDAETGSTGASNTCSKKDAQRRRVAWVTTMVSPDNAMDPLLDDPDRAFDVIFGGRVKPEDMSDLQWKNLVFAQRSIVWELCVAAQPKEKGWTLFGLMMKAYEKNE